MPHAELTTELVILVTGGARGTSGHVAASLAERHRCNLEIIGDAPLPDLEDDVLSSCADAPTIRRLLVDRGLRSPLQIEAEAGRILAGRETLAILAACERAGGRVMYHVCASGDTRGFAALVDEIYARAGRIDGVVHDTGGATLADKLRADVRFIVFLGGSIRENLPELARCMVGNIVSIVTGLDELGRGDAAQVLYMPDAGLVEEADVGRD